MPATPLAHFSYLLPPFPTVKAQNSPAPPTWPPAEVMVIARQGAEVAEPKRHAGSCQ